MSVINDEASMTLSIPIMSGALWRIPTIWPGLVVAPSGQMFPLAHILDHDEKRYIENWWLNFPELAVDI